MDKFAIDSYISDKMKNKINEFNIRERILSEGYGKFDLIETCYPLEEILQARPRVLLKNIMERFSIPEGAINRKTFWSWHLRYKKKNKVQHSDSIFFKEGVDDFKKVLNQVEDWRDFNPSEAENSKQIKPFIKVIK